MLQPCRPGTLNPALEASAFWPTSGLKPYRHGPQARHTASAALEASACSLASYILGTLPIQTWRPLLCFLPISYTESLRQVTLPMQTWMPLASIQNTCRQGTLPIQHWRLLLCLFLSHFLEVLQARHTHNASLDASSSYIEVL